MILRRLCLALAVLPFTPLVVAAEPVQLQEVASFPTQQVTGISVSKAGASS